MSPLPEHPLPEQPLPKRALLDDPLPEHPLVAVVIPSYRVSRQILAVLAGLGPVCDQIYVVDDACPEHSGRRVEAECRDSRVRVVYHERNQGVGGAVLTGYRAALAGGATVIVKMDGDGQMDPAMIPALVRPILAGHADYTKGNRFFDLDGLESMPLLRLAGNTVLSFITKFSSGYWDLFDPTNGFTAIHAAVAARLPFERIARNYFFESDLLFRLNIMSAVALDIPMRARYGDERSSLAPLRVIPSFLGRHAVNFGKRLFYTYLLRNFSMASVQLLLGIPLVTFGVLFGAAEWVAAERAGVSASAGTVMLAALPIIVGFQFLLFFLSYDMQNVPRWPYHRRLGNWRAGEQGAPALHDRSRAGGAESRQTGHRLGPDARP
jgi:dolichol-phosphate mannosyltransferase